VNDSGSLAAFTYTDELSEYFFPFAEESLPDSFCRSSKNASWVLAFQLSVVRFSGMVNQGSCTANICLDPFVRL